MYKQLKYSIILLFVVYSFGPLPIYGAEGVFLPKPGVRVNLSSARNAPAFKGIKVYPNDPLKLDFILDQPANSTSSTGGNRSEKNEEANKLVKYFLTALTIPENDLWVNLSPYEKDRIISDKLGQTALGRDMLAQDYLLKQITASLMHPDGEVGKKFWQKVYQQALEKFGTTNVPVNTINKVWIVPDRAEVFDNSKGTAYITKATLKVMLEEDYLAMHRQPGDIDSLGAVAPIELAMNVKSFQGNSASRHQSSQPNWQNTIIHEIIIPELTKEINEGKNFAPLRQVYQSIILAAWYKRTIKSNVLATQFIDQRKIQGINIAAQTDSIYQQYLQAYKKGVANFVREEKEGLTEQINTRKYFTGGESFGKNQIDGALRVNHQQANIGSGIKQQRILVELKADTDYAMVSTIGIRNVHIVTQKSVVIIDQERKHILMMKPLPKPEDQVGLNLFSPDEVFQLMVYGLRQVGGNNIPQIRGVLIRDQGKVLRRSGLLKLLINMYLALFNNTEKIEVHPEIDNLMLVDYLIREYGFGPAEEHQDPKVFFRFKPQVNDSVGTSYQVYIDPEFFKEENDKRLFLSNSALWPDSAAYDIRIMGEGKPFDLVDEYDFRPIFLGQKLVVKDKLKFKEAIESLIVNVDRAMSTSDMLKDIFKEDLNKALNFIGENIENIARVDYGLEGTHADVWHLNIFLKDGREKSYFVKESAKEFDRAFEAMEVGVGPKIMALTQGNNYRYIEEKAQGDGLYSEKVVIKDINDALSLVRGLAYALGKLHGKGVVHTDLIDNRGGREIAESEKSLHREHIFIKYQEGRWIVSLIDYDYAEQELLEQGDDNRKNERKRVEQALKNFLKTYNQRSSFAEMNEYSYSGGEFWKSFTRAFHDSYITGFDETNKDRALIVEQHEGGVDFKSVNQNVVIRQPTGSSPFQVNRVNMIIKNGLTFNIINSSTVNLQDWLLN